jgi:aminopeptidase N
MTASYHDTWLNEGFATYSEGLHLQVTEGVGSFKRYMKTLYEQVLSDVGGGNSLSDLGPIWLGERLSSLDIPRGKYLIYVKGAYVLHMLRMMMMDFNSKSDERFITMMKDYVQTYTGKVVTTDDFKNLVEKHMGEDMDWFFDQWVYGTEIPIYRFNYDVEEDDGHYLLTIYAQQSDVDPSFEMPVPFVVNFKDGHSVVHVNVKGLRAVGRKFRVPQKPLSVEPNPWNAVLCTVVEWE